MYESRTLTTLISFNLTFFSFFIFPTERFYDIIFSKSQEEFILQMKLYRSILKDSVNYLCRFRLSLTLRKCLLFKTVNR